eukprot:symbB.v1.2.026095.t1/scaffold2583.1/size75752/4
MRSSQDPRDGLCAEDAATTFASTVACTTTALLIAPKTRRRRCGQSSRSMRLHTKEVLLSAPLTTSFRQAMAICDGISIKGASVLVRTADMLFLVMRP